MAKPLSGSLLSQSPDSSCVVYTPAYARSPGTQYRIDLLLESLHRLNLNPALIVDEKETILKQLYERFSASLLAKKSTWDAIGRQISRKISIHKPRTAIVMLDVTAGSAKYLRRQGIKTVVFVEDLTASYHDGIRVNKERAKHVMRVLCEELTYAHLIVTPSYILSRILAEEYGIETLTVPIGAKAYISPDVACKRGTNFALHAGQIHDVRQAIALMKISQELAKHKITVLAHKVGRYVQSVNGITWYKYASPEEAVPYVGKAFLGIIARFKPAFTLSSLYYHMGLLQPILAVGNGLWIEEAELLGVGLVNDIGKIDLADVQKQTSAAERLAIPDVHRPFVDALRKL